MKNLFLINSIFTKEEFIDINISEDKVLFNDNDCILVAVFKRDGGNNKKFNLNIEQISIS